MRVALRRGGGVLRVALGRSGVEGRVVSADNGVEGVGGVCGHSEGRSDSVGSVVGRNRFLTLSSLSVGESGVGARATGNTGGGTAAGLGAAVSGLGIMGACALEGAEDTGAECGSTLCRYRKLLSSKVTSLDNRREWVCLSHSW